MRLYCAIDLHANNSVVAVLDEKDSVRYMQRLPNDLGKILIELSAYREDIVGIAVESTFNWYWLVDGLEEAGYRVHLVNTSAVKQYEGMKHRDDEDDARWLAHLLRLGILPEGYIYPKEMRGVRDLLRKRSQLVRHRTAHLLSIRNLVNRNTGGSMSGNQVKQLRAEDVDRTIPEEDRALAMKSNITVMRCLEEEIKKLETRVLEKTRPKAPFKHLLSIDGFGKVLTLTIMLEAGDINRFPGVGNYASYCRCVGSRNLSNGKKKGEGNRKNGNKYLAWAYIEASHHAIRAQERIRRYYQRKAAKTNSIVAIKAVAHKLARASYHVMKNQAPFQVERAFA